jgi:potassium-dependent mechanosensitive channel
MITPHPKCKLLFLLAVPLVAALLAGATGVAAQTSKTPPPAAAKKAPAQPAPTPSVLLPAEIVTALNRITASLAAAEKELQNLAELEEDLNSLRLRVDEILSDSNVTAEVLRPQLAAVKSQIDKLGPWPGKDDPAEAPEMSEERKRLAGLAAAYDGAIRSSELAGVRARQLVERITLVRHSLFTKNLMERLPSPLLPGVWREIVSDASTVGTVIGSWADDWWAQARDRQGGLALLLAATLLLYAALKLIISKWTDRRRLKAEPPEPTFFERAISAFWVAPLRAMPVLAAGLLAYAGLDALELLEDSASARSVPAILKGVFVFGAVSALLSAVLAPREPQWRLVSFADRPARRIGRLLGAITAVYAIDGAVTEIGRAFNAPLTLSVVQSFASSTVFAALLIGLLLTPFVPRGTSEAVPVSRHTPRWLKLPLWVIAIGIVVAALAGYVALARFATQQLVLTGIVVLVGWLGYLAIRAFTREPPQRGLPVSAMLEQRFGLDAPRRNQLARLTEFALTFALIMGALPFLMLQWGFSGADIRDWSKSLLFGVEIGQFRISLVKILGGIVLFIVLLFATRLFQRWLRDRLLQSRMDPGITHSIETVVGYACTALAALVAVSYAGFDITSLAIVAGALSLGIGFGLQSIVNNFVSGLILLIERPIKVGDWIVLGDQQGNVRRISVRATEIETFDRASLIVPNSELITGRVLNWTHRNSIGRIIVKVGVSYQADPEQVIAILLKCAEEHPQVLRTPAPVAAFDNFGASALEFSLRVQLGDISQALGVQTQLRVAIFKALAAASIEIPFDQMDVNLRDLDGIKRHLAELAEERAAQGASATSNGKRVAGE